jgi:hypothetical protein
VSARARKPPTTEPPDRPSLDDQPTTIFDSDEYPPKRKAQSQGTQTVVDKPVAGAHVTPTIVDKPVAASRAAPTMLEKPAPSRAAVDKAAGSRAAATVPARPVPAAVKAISKQEPSAPIQVISKKDASQPIQVISKKDQSQPIQAISMKTPGEGRPPAADNPPTPIIPRPKLRAVSEVTPAKQQNLGNLASPYDPKEARARAVQEYVIWGCLAVILASAIALVVWFVAR